MITGSILRTQVRTAEPDVGHGFIRDMYVDADITIGGEDTDFAFEVDLVQLGGSSVCFMHHSMAATFHASEGTPAAMFFQSDHPLDIELADDHTRLPGHDAMAFAPFQPYTAYWPELSGYLVALDPDVLIDQVSAAGIDPERFAFAFAATTSPLAAAHWISTCRHVHAVAGPLAGTADHQLLNHRLSELLVGAALTCFPHTAGDPDDPPASGRRAPQGAVRRAVAHLEEHLDQPLTLGDLAAAARVSPRTLQRLFLRVHGCTPTAYLRRARLDAAHRQLAHATPGDGQTVTAVAARWGFHSLPRFGVAYRATYGHPPSHTLRTSD